MTALVPPDARWYPGWARTVAEMRAEGEHVHASGWWVLGRPMEPTEEYFAELLAALPEAAEGDPAAGVVPSDYYWITAGDGGADDEVVGFLNLRHELNESLLEEGGHIGYSVRRSARRQGHATRALALALARCAELGIDRALVTCDEDNEGSRRTIERCGGVLEDVRGTKLRYWIDVLTQTGSTRPA